MAGEQPIDPREQLRELVPPLLQAYGAVFGRMDLLTDFWAQRRPAVFRDEVGVGVGVTPTARHPDIARAEGPPELPQGAQLIVMSVNAADQIHDVGPPLPGDEVGRGLRVHGPPVGGVELL
jgi:hypothetical protein